MVDVTVENHGTIWTFGLHTKEAQEWVTENVEVPDYMTFGGAGFHVEHRCGSPIVEGMRDYGLTVEAA